MKRYAKVSFQCAREKKAGNDPRPETLIPETTAMVIKEAEREHSFWNAFSLLLFLALCAISFLLIYSYGSFEVEKLGFFDLVLLGLSNSSWAFLCCVSFASTRAAAVLPLPALSREKATTGQNQRRQTASDDSSKSHRSYFHGSRLLLLACYPPRAELCRISGT